MVQWLRLCASTAGGTGLIPGWGTKIPHAVWYGQKKKREREKETRTCEDRDKGWSDAGTGQMTLGATGIWERQGRILL